MQEPEKAIDDLRLVEFYANRFKWAKKGAWGAVELVAVLAGLAVSILAWYKPEWTRTHIPERMSNFFRGAMPILAGASVFLIRWLISPYFVYRNAVRAGIVRETALKNELAEKSALLDKRHRDEAVRNQIGSYLSVVKKFVKVCKDPEQIVPKEAIDKWEIEVCIYLREKVSGADEHLFLSEIGVVDPPPCNLIEERAGPLRRLHYRSHQLLKILERLSK